MRASALTFLIATLSASAQTAAPRVDYSRQVHPILAAKCLTCHSEEKRSGGLALASIASVLQGGRSGAAIKPGNAEQSLLIRRITGQVQPQMPFGEDPLSPAEIATIRAWIAEGARATPSSEASRAKWDPPLSLDRPSIPPSPKIGYRAWTAPLDRFVAAYLASARVIEPQLVSDAKFARRAYLDASGLLPSPKDLRSFLDDRTPGKRERLVAALLADNQKYAEHWITFWNDLLRNDEGVNYAGSRKSISEWLLGSLKSNLPYDQFVNKLLNPVTPTDPEGFLVGVNWRGDINASQTPAMQAAQNSAQVFLGVNLKCNSCHDSFISKWKLSDAYSLASYFSTESKLDMYRCDAATGQTAAPGFLYPELNRAPPSDSLNDRHATAAAIFTDPRNGRLPRTLVNRVWQRLLGHGIVEPVDEMDSEPWSPELLDWLASDFVEHRYDLKHLIAAIMNSRAYQMASVTRRAVPSGKYAFRGPEIRRLSAEEFADAIGAITGEWRVYQPDSARQGAYTREWRVIASPMTRALGRPIRDQVITTRNEQATMLQALELVNGESITHWLSRGAMKMLGELPAEPTGLFDSGLISGSGRANPPNPVKFDLDISKAQKLWLLVQDRGSYAPELVEPVWASAEFVAADGAITPLTAIKPVAGSGLRDATGPIEFKGTTGVPGLRVTTPSRLEYDLAGKGFTRFRGVAAHENNCLRDDIQPRSRFFIFNTEPNMERLVPVASTAPTITDLTPPDSAKLVDRLFWHALGRAPSLGERSVAESALRGSGSPGEHRPSAAGMADLLWSVLMNPEFQLIY